MTITKEKILAILKSTTKEMFQIYRAPPLASGTYKLYPSGKSKILFVAHTDTVNNDPDVALFKFHNQDWLLSNVHDDRIGVYIGKIILPRLGLEDMDVLLTTDEEKGQTTAKEFKPKTHNYNWMFSFDRADDSGAFYGYDDKYQGWEKDVKEYIKASHGSFSCIKALDHLDIPGINWPNHNSGNHSPSSFINVPKLVEEIERFIQFYTCNLDKKYARLPEKKTYTAPWSYQSNSHSVSSPDVIVTHCPKCSEANWLSSVILNSLGFPEYGQCTKCKTFFPSSHPAYNLDSFKKVKHRILETWATPRFYWYADTKQWVEAGQHKLNQYAKTSPKAPYVTCLACGGLGQDHRQFVCLRCDGAGEVRKSKQDDTTPLLLPASNINRTEIEEQVIMLSTEIAQLPKSLDMVAGKNYFNYGFPLIIWETVFEIWKDKNVNRFIIDKDDGTTTMWCDACNTLYDNKAIEEYLDEIFPFEFADDPNFTSENMLLRTITCPKCTRRRQITEHNQQLQAN